MEWVQVLTIIITIIASTLGGVFIFYQIMHERLLRMEDFHREDMKSHQEDMKSHREDMKMIDQSHREDMKSHREDMKSIDQKWERLFERLSLQDQKRA